MIKGFNKNAFMEWITNNIEIGTFGVRAVENIIDYAAKYEHVSKDQFAYFISEMIPEVIFSEVAFFCDDDILTDYGKAEKSKCKYIKVVSI